MASFEAWHNSRPQETVYDYEKERFRQSQKSRKDRKKWGRSVQIFLNKGPLALIKLLMKEGIPPELY